MRLIKFYKEPFRKSNKSIKKPELLCLLNFHLRPTNECKESAEPKAFSRSDYSLISWRLRRKVLTGLSDAQMMKSHAGNAALRGNVWAQVYGPVTESSRCFLWKRTTYNLRNAPYLQCDFRNSSEACCLSSLCESINNYMFMFTRSLIHAPDACSGLLRVNHHLCSCGLLQGWFAVRFTACH